MLRWPCLLYLVVLLGCDALLYDNPKNCVLSPDACGRDFYCNSASQRCETLDCTVNAGLCTATEDCDPVARRCQTRTFVLGQPSSTDNLNVAFGLRSPWSPLFVPDPATPGKTRFLIADSANNRVLIWSDVPTKNSPADAVLGMPDVNTLSGTGPYNGVNEGSLSSPWSLASDGTKLIVGDRSQNRVLIWDRIPSLPGLTSPTPANGVWGQSSFESSQLNGGQPSVNASGLGSPRAFAERLPGSGFFIADQINNRVLGFAGIPTSPTQLPDAVLGQTSFMDGIGSVGPSGLSGPLGLFSDGVQLYVSDSLNHRVLTFSLPLSSGAAATAVLGQLTFMGNLPNRGLGTPGNNTLALPHGLWQVNDGMQRLFVSDVNNNRVLRFTNGAKTADLVLGQKDFTSNLGNRGGAPAADTLYAPTDVTSDGTRLAITDWGNQRVLIWQSLPQVNDAPADVVIGQPDFTSQLANAAPLRSGLLFRSPAAVSSDGTRLVVADSGNHRVLVWNQMPSSGAVPPDLVLGQSDFTSESANRGLTTPSAATLSNPRSVALDGGRLAVADTDNHRVLLWNQIPGQSGVPADFVIGQTSFGIKTPQPPASGLNMPMGVFLYQGMLFVADTGNNRILGYADPFRAGATASVVIGQPDFDMVVANKGGQSAGSLDMPRAILVQEGQLLVADTGNNRVLVFKNLPTVNFQRADLVIGQLDFGSSYSRADRTRLEAPGGLLVHAGRLYVSSTNQNRVLYWNQLPTQNGQRADGVLGQTDFLSTLPRNPDLPPVERLSAPVGMSAANGLLLIADTLDNRVVVRGMPN